MSAIIDDEINNDNNINEKNDQKKLPKTTTSKENKTKQYILYNSKDKLI